MMLKLVAATLGLATANPIQDHLDQPPAWPTKAPYHPPKSFVDCINTQARQFGVARKGFDRCQQIRSFECDNSCSGPNTCCPINSTRANAPTQDYAWGYVCPNGWNAATGANGEYQCSDCRGGPWGKGCGDICAHDVMRCHAAFDCPNKFGNKGQKSPCPSDTPYCIPSENSVNVQAGEPKCSATQPTKPTRRPHTTGPRPKPGACPRGRGDLPADKLKSISGGLITGGCEQLFADVLEDGQDCDTSIKDVIPDFPKDQGTLENLCCATCAKQVDPITAECESNVDTCKQDLDVFEKECGSKANGGSGVCDALGSNSKTDFDWAKCQECRSEVFGDELTICSCCMLPFLAEVDTLLPDDKIGYLFPCKDGRQ
jgi:hypothetical protein